mgnify:CR=1 FL=1
MAFLRRVEYGEFRRASTDDFAVFLSLPPIATSRR